MDNKCSCGYYPTVIIPGIGQSKVDLLDNEGNRVKSAWPLDLDTEAIVKKILPSAAKMMLTRRDGGFTDVLYNAICDGLQPLSANTDGIPKAQLKVVTYERSLAECTDDEKRYIYKMVPMEQLAEVIGEDHLYFFAFHSFGQPYETARDLHRFIQNVKQQTGHDKVNLVPVSLGGSIAVAYFDAYGDRCDVHRVMNFVPAGNGSSIASDVLENRVNSDKPEEIFDFVLDRKTAEKITSYMHMLPKGMPEKIINAVLKAACDTIFINCPAIWAIIPREKYPQLREQYLCDGRHEALKAKADRYDRAHRNYEALYKLQAERGVEFFTICGYGKQLVPFVKSDNINCDTIVDVGSASLGAYSVDNGETLPDDYRPVRENCKNKNHNHISPERTVDAGACLFPDSTWFFSNQIHDDIAYNDVALLICREVLTNDEFKSVYSNPAFPQFNGARNIREIKYKLLPRAEELLGTELHEHIENELKEAVEQAKALFTYTIVADNSAAKAATERLKAAVLAAQPDLSK